MQALPSRSASGEQVPNATPPFFHLSPNSSWASRPEGVSLPWHPAGVSDGGIPTEALVGDAVAEGIGLAHDAGNLLGAIRLYCDLLALPGVLRSEHRHYADELRQLGARGGTLIERLLRTRDAARERGKQGVEPRGLGMVRLAEVVAGCRGLLDTLAGNAGLLVSLEAGAPALVAVPQEAVERILVNLVKNAVEASADGSQPGSVTVRVRAVPWAGIPGDGVSLSVEDRGRGMSETAVRALVAGPGAGAGAGRPGRGIGGRVVRELAAATGGELRVRSRPGRGTTVELVWAAVPEGAAGSG